MSIRAIFIMFLVLYKFNVNYFTMCLIVADAITSNYFFCFKNLSLADFIDKEKIIYF